MTMYATLCLISDIMVRHMKVWLILVYVSLLYNASFTMLMKQLVWLHDVLCGLCEQEERAKLAGELQWAESKRRDLEYQLETCLKETDTLRKQMEKEMSDHQVSESSFSPFQTRIIHYHLHNLEGELLCSVFTLMHKVSWPITVAARCKAWIVFTRSNTGTVGWNPTQGMDVSVRSFSVVLFCEGSGLVTGWTHIHVVLPTVYRIKKLKKWLRSNKGL
jgi:hypothetical protein